MVADAKEQGIPLPSAEHLTLVSTEEKETPVKEAALPPITKQGDLRIAKDFDVQIISTGVIFRVFITTIVSVTGGATKHVHWDHDFPKELRKDALRLLSQDCGTRGHVKPPPGIGIRALSSPSIVCTQRYTGGDEIGVLVTIRRNPKSGDTTATAHFDKVSPSVYNIEQIRRFKAGALNRLATDSGLGCPCGKGHTLIMGSVCV